MGSVLLASGGLDSTVLAAVHPCEIHLTVDYGQRHAAQERRAATQIAAHYGAELVLVRLPAIGAMLRCPLTGAEPGELTGPRTVVPNRNAILISLGVALAEQRGAGAVVIGANADDYPVYRDCRPDFIHAADAMAAHATAGRVGVRAPLVFTTKPEIGALADELGVPVGLTWSCYVGGADPCLVCDACLQRGRALGVHHR